ncbi:MAG: hypothetical protein UY21_C0013G0031 [Microgenomates group bacterium GW2011_GWA1_48_10]|uniref:Uncharacterized protein n=1 Tax=Candidatus Gottesmanbacteria bacterium RIFCSPHIGHO2_01_FULL_47_48 TaxID=1798381 RepID=A0A1F6A587_9BACT|nr:MAG: hypothetical protein UY21_C0013G0031 [Microgenomates group bacterium GW2011_GWA1_48_10]OGG19622.1 MAG: hypothetical protein A2721_03040 [Candidatus Gottesmanbacteria bacterium RIFCSPHIGHO2_01_FULL_47_48]
MTLLQNSIVFFIVTLINFLSLLPPAIKGPATWKTLFKNPGFLLGDFFFIPLYGALIFNYFLATKSSLILSWGNISLYLTEATFIILLIFFIFHPEKVVGIKVFIPHIIFSIAVIVSLLASLTTAITLRSFNQFLILALICLCLHTIISWIFPKRFDNLPGLFQARKIKLKI